MDNNAEFSFADRVQSCQICLLIRNVTVSNTQYITKDFGYTTDTYEWIYPLNISAELSVMNGSRVFWCANISVTTFPTQDGLVRVFPILRYAEYEGNPRILFAPSRLYFPSFPVPSNSYL